MAARLGVVAVAVAAHVACKGFDPNYTGPEVDLGDETGLVQDAGSRRWTDAGWFSSHSPWGGSTALVSLALGAGVRACDVHRLSYPDDDALRDGGVAAGEAYALVYFIHHEGDGADAAGVARSIPALASQTPEGGIPPVPFLTSARTWFPEGAGDGVLDVAASLTFDLADGVLDAELSPILQRDDVTGAVLGMLDGSFRASRCPSPLY